MPKKAGSPATTGTQPGRKSTSKSTIVEPGGRAVARLLVAGAEVISKPVVTRENDRDNVVLEVDSDKAIQLMLAQANNEIFQIIYRPFGETDESISELVQRDRDPRVIEVIKGVKKKNVLTKLGL